ncbi:MAG: hypothetical protein M1829_003500 [Trizodia sp. TS-e1964]|nr:MAG: hypothetical protein M1829_003500 [Trizodia sp. TS-e1964]
MSDPIPINQGALKADATTQLDAGSLPTATQESVESLAAQALQKYAIKEYSEAANFYAKAAELQASINGDMCPENAEVLYQYGRALYKVGVSKSNILGDMVAAAEGEASKGKQADKDKAASCEAEVPKASKRENAAPKKPHFRFTEDENPDESSNDSDEAPANESEGAGAENDDLADAFEVLDLSRILFQRQLEGMENGKPNVEHIRKTKERLADVHDFLAEISLEGERFPEAVTDFKAALALKKELLDKDSNLIAEAHFKLSLALEFAAATIEGGEKDGEKNGEKNGEKDGEKGEELQASIAWRDQAVLEMEAAIECCRLRVAKEEAKLVAQLEKGSITRESIDDVKEMIRDMELRLIDLRQPQVAIDAGSDQLAGLLGTLTGETTAAKKAILEDATRDATDLTGLVRRKGEAALGKGEASTVKGSKAVYHVDTKRKMEADGEPAGKRARVEEVAEE